MESCHRMAASYTILEGRIIRRKKKRGENLPTAISPHRSAPVTAVVM